MSNHSDLPANRLVFQEIRHDRESYAEWLLEMDPKDPTDRLTMEMEISSLREVEDLPYWLSVLVKEIEMRLSVG